MPMYDIKCTNEECDYDNELVCSIKEYENYIINEVCPKCKNKLRQVISSVRFELKGYGWSLPSTLKGKGYHRQGSKSDMEDAEREYDYLDEKSTKDPNWKKARERADELAYKHATPSL